MKRFVKALKDLVLRLIVTIIALPVMILAIIVYELLDPFVMFYDTLKYNKDEFTKEYV